MPGPLEIVDTLSKTELVRKFNQILKANSEMEQRQATSTIKQKIASDAEKASEPEKSDLLIISEENLKKNGKKRDKKDKQDKEDENQAVDDERDAEHLDLKA
jgi:hypothetical protein